MTIEANLDHLWVVRQSAATQIGGILLPDSAKPKVHKGKIITVGETISGINTSKVRVGRIAIFNKSAGFEIEENGVTYTILRLNDIIGTDSEKHDTIGTL